MMYTLAFMVCMAPGPNSECRSMWMEFTTMQSCLNMKSEVISEARKEGLRVMAVCSLSGGDK